MRAARVHHAARRRGGSVAARGAGAAARRCRRIGALGSWRQRIRHESKWVGAFRARFAGSGLIDQRGKMTRVRTPLCGGCYGSHLINTQPKLDRVCTQT